MDIRTSPLLTDLYQLNMLQSYLDHGMTETAVFEFFSRKLPQRRGFLMDAALARFGRQSQSLFRYADHGNRHPNALFTNIRA